MSAFRVFALLSFITLASAEYYDIWNGDGSSPKLFGGIASARGFCKVTYHKETHWYDFIGVVGSIPLPDIEEVGVQFRDIWGNPMFQCSRQDSVWDSDESDCADRDVGTLNILPVSGNDQTNVFGPERLNSQSFLRVGHGNEISMTNNGGYETRSSSEKWVDGNIKTNGKCVKMGNPMIKVRCNSGYTKIPGKVVDAIRIAGPLIIGTSKLQITETIVKSVKVTDTTSTTITHSLSTEGSMMIGIEGAIKLGASIKAVVTDTTATTNTNSVEKSTVVTNSRTYETSFTCSGPNPCYGYQVTTEYCETQDLSHCQFVDPLPEYSSFRPDAIILKYCHSSTSLAQSDSPDETRVSFNERTNNPDRARGNGNVMALLSKAESKQGKGIHSMMKKKKKTKL
jgi:hypothetical protein